MSYEDKPGLSQLTREDAKSLEATAKRIGDRIC